MEKFFKSWLGFDEMITPRIITVIYWILMVLTIVGSVVAMFLNFIFGLASLIFGVLGVRVGCELVILSFNIYKTIKKIADNQNQNSINPRAENE